MKWTGVFIVLLLMVSALPQSYAAGGETDVVVTINVIADMVEQIGGERVDVKSIVTGLENPHTYSTTPEDRQAVENSDIFMEIGMGLEPWADELAGDLPGDRVLVLSDNCTKLGSNPHVWMDPENGKAMAWDIAKALSRIDPDGRDYYMANLRAYLSEISYAEARAIALGRDAGNSGVITATAGFSYLLKRMNISEVHTLVKGPGDTPTVEDIAMCENAVRNGDAYALIDLAQSPSPAIEQISKDTGAVVVVGTPLLGVLGIEHYTDLITYNAQAIHDGILDGERSRDINLLENRVDALSSQIMLLGAITLFLVAVAVFQAIQIRKLRKGDF